MLVPYFEAARSIWTINEYIGAMGWVMVVAMIVGGILDDDYKSIVKWLFAGVVFVILQEASRGSLLRQMNATDHAIAVITSFSTLLVYSIGVTIGWTIVFMAKRRVHRTMGVEVNVKPMETSFTPKDEANKTS